MPDLELITPCPELKESYRSYVGEFAARNEPPIPFVLGFDSGDFESFLRRLDDCRRGVGVPEEFSPHSTFWLVRDRVEIVGVSNLRHGLTPRLRREGGNIGYSIRPGARGLGFGGEILARTLARAAGLGLGAALVTCAKSNPASARVILGNGGIWDSEEFIPERGFIIQRYWIPLSPPASRR
ncbi:MAG TPA: GNAT family N-acetyltransferase [Opitutaceae bacterium]|nr:GNAT family N-acetyltransferase [Opitutaceae bacterium]